MEPVEDENQSKHMEAEDQVDFETTKATSWRVVDGSLDDAVTCESSLSAVGSDSSAVGRGHPLVLRRPSPDSGACEIKISFKQQYEIKQVYVKSTARVYEIYYAANPQNINEYLCSVRCGMAAKNKDPLEVTREEVLLETGGSRTVSVSSSGSTKHLDDEVKTESGSSTNEYGWVEVKDLKCAGLDDGDDLLSGKIEAVMQRDYQDFYEATAEISDGKPCTSISLRLLSVQSGESVYINEVYVFADPVLSNDEDSSSAPSKMENSSGNSLMSMLVPTLLQLSRSRMGQLHERNDAGTTEKKAYADIGWKTFVSGSTSDKIQKDAIPGSANGQGSISEKLDTASVQSAQVEVPSQPLSREGIPGSCGINHSLSHIEKMLEQLFLRVAKIEEFCSRFEGKMINPIANMETRLEKVEQHLELINKNFSFPLTSSGTGISAPDFFYASESNSLPNDGKIFSGCKASESSREDDCPADEVTAPVADIPSTANVCHLVPRLVVTAPDFSCADDEEENDVIETVLASPQDITRKPVSINDALASALAGFLSSTLPQNQTSAPLPEVSIANFSGDKSSGDKEACLNGKCDDTVGPFPDSSKTCEIDNTALADEGKHELVAGTCSGEVTETAFGLDHLLHEQHPEKYLVCDVEDQRNKVEKGANELFDLGYNGISISVHESGPNDVPDIAQEALVNVADSTSGEVGKGNGFGLLHGVLGLPSPSMIDFKIPILEVKFASQEDLKLKSSSLEALLIAEAESCVTNLCLKEEDVAEISDRNHPVKVQDNKSACLESNGPLLVDMDDDGSRNLSLSTVGVLQEPNEYINQTMS